MKKYWPGSFPNLELEALVEEVEDGWSLKDPPPARAQAFSRSLPSSPSSLLQLQPVEEVEDGWSLKDPPPARAQAFSRSHPSSPSSLLQLQLEALDEDVEDDIP